MRKPIELPDQDPLASASAVRRAKAEIRGRRKKVPTVQREQVSIRLGAERLERLERTTMRMTARPPYVEVTASHLVRLAVDHYLDHLTLTSPDLVEPRRQRPPCAAVVESGVGLCVTCGHRFVLSEAICPRTGGPIP